jgi:hypothetical protein
MLNKQQFSKESAQQHIYLVIESYYSYANAKWLHIIHILWVLYNEILEALPFVDVDTSINLQLFLCLAHGLILDI